MSIDSDTGAAQLTILHCGYRASCRERRGSAVATIILRKSDRGGRFMRQIEMCDLHAGEVIARETGLGLQVVDWRKAAPTTD
ncbi:MAG: hypothetical protein EXS36_12965 [Pedosphaera sp.]|nr:hypothetical protein [Pedosphaera sp.]